MHATAPHAQRAWRAPQGRVCARDHDVLRRRASKRRRQRHTHISRAGQHDLLHHQRPLQLQDRRRACRLYRRRQHSDQRSGLLRRERLAKALACGATAAVQGRMRGQPSRLQLAERPYNAWWQRGGLLCHARLTMLLEHGAAAIALSWMWGRPLDCSRWHGISCSFCSASGSEAACRAAAPRRRTCRR
jgi:hypothetical protein